MDTCMALSYPVTLVWMITVELCVTPLVAHVACVTSTLTPRSDRPYQGYVCTENIPQINRSKKNWIEPNSILLAGGMGACVHYTVVVWCGRACTVPCATPQFGIMLGPTGGRGVISKQGWYRMLTVK